MLTLEVVNGVGIFTDGKEVLTWREVIRHITGFRDIQIDQIAFTEVNDFFKHSFDISSPAYKAIFWKDFYNILRTLLRYSRKFNLLSEDETFKFSIRYLSTEKTKKAFIIPHVEVLEDITKNISVSFGNKDCTIRNRKVTKVIAQTVK